MARKPKTWRGLEVQGDCRTVQEYPGQRKHYDCTVVPDGATVPLPASVRRIVRAAVQWQHSGHVTGMCMAATMKLSKAIEAHERATKAKGKS